MANKLLVEKYYSELNEGIWDWMKGVGRAIWGGTVAGGKAVGNAITDPNVLSSAAQAAVPITINSQLTSLARDIMAGGRGSAEQKPEPGPRYEVNFDIAKEMSKSGGLPDSYYKQMADLQSQGKSATYRSSTQIRQRALATSMARRDMNAAREAAWSTDEIKKLQQAYNNAETGTAQKQDLAAKLRTAKSNALASSNDYQNASKAVQAHQQGPMNLQTVGRGGSNRNERHTVKQGRLVQRVGELALRPPRNADEAERLNNAKADLEAAYDEAEKSGTALGYEDNASLYSGFARRGFVSGGGRTKEFQDRESKAAGQKAFDDAVGFSTAGMSRDQIKGEMLKKQRERSAEEEGKIRKELETKWKAEEESNKAEKLRKRLEAEAPLIKKWEAEDAKERGDQVKSMITPKPATSKPEDKPAYGVPELLAPNPPVVDQPEWRVDQQPGPSAAKFGKAPDYPTPETTDERNARLRRDSAARGPLNLPKAPDYPTPATREELIARTVEDIKTRNARTQARRRAMRTQDRATQRKTTSDAEIRGAGQELRKNIGIIYDKLRNG